MNNTTQILLYLAIAFGITWAVWGSNALQYRKTGHFNPFFHFLGGIGPISAAIIATYLSGSSVRTLLGKTYAYQGRQTGLMMALSGGVTLALSLAGALMYSQFDSEWKFNFNWIYFLGGTVATFVIIPLEEVGWRGFLLPRLLQSTGQSRFSASVIMGVAWSLWHLPFFFYIQPHLRSSLTAVTVAQDSFAYALGLGVVSYIMSIAQEKISHSSLLPALAAHSIMNGSFGAFQLETFGNSWYWFALAAIPAFVIMPILANRQLH